MSLICFKNKKNKGSRLKKLPADLQIYPWASNRQFFESLGYPLLPIKNRLLVVDKQYIAFRYGDFLSAYTTIPAACTRLNKEKPSLLSTFIFTPISTLNIH
jgi:hypothetical protein